MSGNSQLHDTHAMVVARNRATRLAQMAEAQRQADARNAARQTRGDGVAK